MDKKKIFGLISRNRISDLIDFIYDEIEDDWFDEKTIDGERLTLFSVVSFIGEVRNGGVPHFLGSDYGRLVTELPSSFKALGLSDYFDIASRLSSLVHKIVSDDPDDMWKAVTVLKEDSKRAKELEALEEDFWKIYADFGQSEIDEKLVNFVKDHVEAFNNLREKGAVEKRKDRMRRY